MLSESTVGRPWGLARKPRISSLRVSRNFLGSPSPRRMLSRLASQTAVRSGLLTDSGKALINALALSEARICRLSRYR